jgi:hypothetical protein
MWAYLVGRQCNVNRGMLEPLTWNETGRLDEVLTRQSATRADIKRCNRRKPSHVTGW